MQTMSMQDSRYAPNGNEGNPGAPMRSAYIPPHLRGKIQQTNSQPPPPQPQQPQPQINNGPPPNMGGSSWANGPTPAQQAQGNSSGGWANAPSFTPSAGGGGAAPSGGKSWDGAPRPQRTFNENAYGNSSGGGGGGGRGGGGGGGSGEGTWRDGKHVIGNPNQRLERELFGVPNDPLKQSTGINFEKYDDIPVEASGQNVPDPVNAFTNPPLDNHLISNIELARYTVPTPVQKYSIPIVMGGRDLMACAQTGSGKTGGFLFPILAQSFATGPSPPPPGAQGGNFGRSRKAFPTALILAPTRELVSQIYDESRKFAYRSWVKPCVIWWSRYRTTTSSDGSWM